MELGKEKGRKVEQERTGRRKKQKLKGRKG